MSTGAIGYVMQNSVADPRMVVTGHVSLRDDGLGNLKNGAVTVGTINYTTGAFDVPDTYSILTRLSQQTKATGGDYNRSVFTLNNDPELKPYLWGTGGSVGGYWGSADSQAALPVQAFTWTPTLDLTPGHAEEVVPGSVRLSYMGKALYDRTGVMYWDLNPSNGSGTAVGTVDYSTGLVNLTSVISGSANSGTVTGLVTSVVGNVIDAVTFRTAASPIRPGSLVIQFARATGGGITTVTANTNGTISATGVIGTVDVQTGIVRLRFGTWVTAAGNEAEPWYDPVNVVNGQVFSPRHVLGDTIRYAAVSYVYIPLDASILGINPVRLPQDGKVPLFHVGGVVVVHHTGLHSGTYISNEVVNLGRTRITRVRVLDSTGAEINTGKYTVNLDTGILTFGNLTGLSQPLTIEDRIEDTGLLSDVQINGQLTVTRPLTHDYPTGSSVSSALLIGDMFARYTNVFDQATWTSVWSDTVIGTNTLAEYNDVQYPIVVTNRGAIQERWAIIFTNSTAFNVIGENVGLIATGNTSTDLAPNNPSQSVPYFTLAALGWGGGWAAGNVLRFNTVAANFPVGVVRTIQQGPATAQSDVFTIQIRGDVNV